MLALFLFIICDVCNERVSSPSARAGGPQWARNKIESTVSAEKYVGQVGPYCAVVVTWFCASVFGRFLMLSPALRVFEVRDGQQVKLLTIIVPVRIKIHVVGVRAVDVNKRGRLAQSTCCSR
jgi:hypothetical protein